MIIDIITLSLRGTQSQVQFSSTDKKKLLLHIEDVLFQKDHQEGIISIQIILNRRLNELKDAIVWVAQS